MHVEVAYRRSRSPARYPANAMTQREILGPRRARMDRPARSEASTRAAGWWVRTGCAPPPRAADGRRHASVAEGWRWWVHLCNSLT